MVFRRRRGRGATSLRALALSVAVLALLGVILTLPTTIEAAGLTPEISDSTARVTLPTGPRLGFLSLSQAKGGFGTAGSDGKVTPISLAASARGPVVLPLMTFAWVGGGEAVVFAGAILKASDPQETDHQRLYLLPATGGRPVAIPHTDGGSYPVAFPDGQTIAFLRIKGRNEGTSITTPSGKVREIERHEHTSIWLVRTDGSGLRRLTPWVTDPVIETPSSVSPDGRQLVVNRAVHSARERTVELAFDVETGLRTLLVSEAYDAAFSPDGSRLAVIRLRRFPGLKTIHLPHGKGTLTLSGKSVVEVQDLATGVVEPIVDGGERAIGALSWDPSGQRLAFTETGSLRNEASLFGIGDTVIEVNPDGSCPTPVLHKPGFAFISPLWRPGPGREAGPIAC